MAVRLTPRRLPTGYVAGGSLVRNFRTKNGSRRRKKRTPHSEPPHLQASAPLACNLPPSSVGPTGCHLGPLTQKLDVPLSSFLHTKLCGRFTDVKIHRRKCGIHRKESCAVRGTAPCVEIFSSGGRYAIILYIDPNKSTSEEGTRRVKIRSLGFLRTKRAKVMAFHPRHSRPEFFPPVK